jgi:alpha/beta superfamily hydrolase
MSIKAISFSKANIICNIQYYVNLTRSKVEKVFFSIINNKNVQKIINFTKEKINYIFLKIDHFKSYCYKSAQSKINKIKNKILLSIKDPIDAKLGSILLPAQNVSKEKVIKEQMDIARQELLEIKNSKEINIKTFDNENINGVFFRSTKNTNYLNILQRKKENTKIVLHFNGMGEVYEDHANTHFISDMTKSGFDLFLFNYRNIAKSTGKVNKENIIKDSFIIYDYLLSLGYEKKDIIIHGHSFGASIATHLASFYEESPIINDRSFSSLLDAATQIFIQPIKNGFNMQDDTRVKVLMETKIKNILSFFLESWNINVKDLWEKMRNKKILIVSKKDEIIYYPASLAGTLNETYQRLHFDDKLHNDELNIKQWKKVFKSLT